jgi:hypothetical protein
MADTGDTAASLSPADQVEKPEDSPSASPEEMPSASPQDGAEGRRQEPAEPDERQGEAEQSDGHHEEAEESEDSPSLTELIEQLGRDLGELGVSEAQLEAARNMPEVRRAARDIVGTVVLALAALTGFALLNVAAVDGLSKAISTGLAALVLGAIWLAIAGVLLVAVMGRARHWLMWLLLKAPPNDALEELERERDAAGRAALDTLERIGPALAVQVALAAVPSAGDVADGVVEFSDDLLEASDEIIEVVAEQVPGGGVVNQVWGVALRPGRFGIKVATMVFSRSKPAE